MNKNLLTEIIKTKNSIREKYRALKRARAETEAHLAETFKPITKPLEELITKAKFEPKNEIKHEPKEEENDDDDYTMTPPKRKYFKMESTSTPKSSTMDEDEEEDEEDEEQEGFATPTQSTMLMRTVSLTDISSTGPVAEYMKLYLNKSSKIDKAYGVYLDNEGWKIGNSKLDIDGDDIIIKEKTYKATPGLLELLFMKKPDKKTYTADDMHNYGAIMKDTNFYRRHFEDDGQIKGSGSEKYTKIVKKLIYPEGQGLMMNIPKDIIDYMYWDDPNELVDRLRLLIASQQAGNNTHNNEIVSIIEELKEADIIE